MLTLAEIAAELEAELQGDGRVEIHRLATLEEADDSSLAFLANPSYRKQLTETRAAAVILRAGDAGAFNGHCLIHPDPYVAFARLTARFDRAPRPAAGIHPSAVIAPDAVLGEGVAVGANAVIGEGVVIGAHTVIGANTVIAAQCRVGEHCQLAANVTLYHDVRLGDRVIVHSGAVLGADGFGFANDRGRWVKVHQLGGVVVGDDCEIGACTTIDRGALSDTVLGRGVILDNHCQIAHNVRIGDYTAMAAFVGISGSTVIGRHCIFAGRAGTVGHVTICDNVVVTAASVVTKSLHQPGSYSSGVPLAKTEEWRKNAVRFNQLDRLASRVRKLENKDSN